MLTVVMCPHCRGLIETNRAFGQVIPCPHCRTPFVLAAGLTARSSGVWNTLIKLCIPLGYALFVAVPMAFTIWFVVTRAEEQEQRQADAGAEVPPPANKKPALPPPPPPRKKRAPPIDPDAVTRPGKNQGRAEPDANPTDPDPKPAAPVPPIEPPTRFAVPPVPRAVAEVPVAPMPHAPTWPPVLVGSQSEWQQIGAVDVRVGGSAITKVPLIDGRGRERESAQPHLVVVIEARANAAGRRRDLQPLRSSQEQYAVIFMDNGRELPFVHFPLGTRINVGLLNPRPIPADGTPVRGVLLFAVPPDGAGAMKLRLDGDRCGEPGDIWFKLPPGFWKP